MFDIDADDVDEQDDDDEDDEDENVDDGGVSDMLDDDGVLTTWWLLFRLIEDLPGNIVLEFWLITILFALNELASKQLYLFSSWFELNL